MGEFEESHRHVSTARSPCCGNGLMLCCVMAACGGMVSPEQRPEKSASAQGGMAGYSATTTREPLPAKAGAVAGGYPSTDDAQETEALCLDFAAMATHPPSEDPICEYYTMEAVEPSTAVFVDDCTVPFRYDLFAPNRVYLYVDCVPIPQRSPDGTPNWVPLYPAAPNLDSCAVMVGTLCERVSAIGVRRIDLLVGCEVYPIL